MPDDTSLYRSVQQLLTRFGRYADAGDGQRLAGLFLADGVLTVGDAVVTGREAISRFTNERCADPNRRTRHVWNNLVVEPGGESEFGVTCIQQTFEQIGSHPACTRVNDVQDYVKVEPDGDVYFISRRVSRVMCVGA